MQKARKWICLVLAVLAISGAVVGQLAVQEQTQLAGKLVRFHIRANSDSEADQSKKLLVRDAVLAQVEKLTKTCDSSDEALLVLSDNLPALARTAAETLRKAGSGEAVTVKLCEEGFETRMYDTFSLPAGKYTALRIDIGAAAGHNWWCVAFPTLCKNATTEGMEQSAMAAGFTEDEVALLEDSTPQVQIRFRVLEWLQTLGDFFKTEKFGNR